MPGVRVVVRGRVQGVGFRHFTRQAARALGVTGEVWNRSDGGVEMVAEHADPEALDAFVREIELGPGYVRDVLTEPVAERGRTDFDVGPSR